MAGASYCLWNSRSGPLFGALASRVGRLSEAAGWARQGRSLYWPCRAAIVSPSLLGFNGAIMKFSAHLFIAVVVLTFSVGSAMAQHTYSKAVQKACANDYRSHCGQYGIETDALRLCMDKAGHGLSKTCIDALVDAGEVSKAEVERRKRTGK